MTDIECDVLIDPRWLSCCHQRMDRVGSEADIRTGRSRQISRLKHKSPGKLAFGAYGNRIVDGNGLAEPFQRQIKVTGISSLAATPC